MTIVERPSLRTDQFKHFADLIYNVSGIRFQESKAYFLASKLENRRKDLELDSIDAYFTYVSAKPKFDKEYELLLNEVTINETFFYRNQSQIDSYNNEIIPEILAAKRKVANKILRVWSAASSTGDEAYTIVMDFLERGLHREFKLEVYATDISNKVLETARQGTYKKYAVRNIPEHLLKRYFEQIDDYTYKLTDEIKRYVTFKYCNLSDSLKCAELPKFDIVFCRNVLIYFDRDSREKVLKNIYNNLLDHGYLLVGHSENLYAERHLFEADKEKLQALAYKKAPKGTEKAKF